jgi:hypothetical protein
VTDTASLLRVLCRLVARLCWLHASLGFDTRLDDRLNKGWILWIGFRLVRSGHPAIRESVKYDFPNVI